MTADGGAPARHDEACRALVEVAPGVLVATAETWRTTSTVVVGRNAECLLVDPALTVPEVVGLTEEVARRGLRVTGAFSSHGHWDHALWDGTLPDVPRWATVRAVAALAATREHAGAECAALAPGHDPAHLDGLTALAEGTARLPWAGRAVDVVAHDAHSPGHAALVVHPVERPAGAGDGSSGGAVLLAGDMLSDTEVPLLDTDAPSPFADYRAGLAALERAIGAAGTDVVVPGHGSPALGRAAVAARLAADRRYLDRLEDAVRGPGTAVADERLSGYVATWHEAQLAALRAR